MSAPVFGGIDVLNLGYEVQSSSPGTAPTRATATGSDGDQIASNTHYDKITGTITYIIDVATFAGPWPGQIANTDYIILGVAIDYSPCAAGKRPLVTFTYQNGSAATTPFSYQSVLTLPLYGGVTPANVDVPELLTVTGGSSEIQTANWGLTCQIGEDLDKDGELLALQCYNGEETVSMQFVGTPTSITAVGWDLVATPAPGENTTNTGYGTSSYNYVRGVTRS